MKSFIKNCIISAKENDTLFASNKDGQIIARLDGYAIIPVEEYKKMKSKKSDAENINNI